MQRLVVGKTTVITHVVETHVVDRGSSWAKVVVRILHTEIVY